MTLSKKPHAPHAGPAPRILLVDDHALFRTGLRMVLAMEPSVGEIIEACTLDEALAYTGAPVSIVLLDIQMPGLNGLHGITVLKKRIAKIPIIVLSSQDDAATVHSARLQGAAGFVSKADAAGEILRAIAEVLAGGHFFSSAISAPRNTVSPVSMAPFTARQLEVLKQLCLGSSNKIIARKLDMAENTVRVHVAAILEHLGATNRSEAILAAQRRGIIR